MPSTATSLSRRASVGLVALLTCAVFASACSSSNKSGSGAGASSSTTGSSASSSNTVHVKNYSFNPQAVTVAVGTKVTWIFDDNAAHTVTASDGSFKSGDLSSGGTYSHVFNAAGTYAYICSIHQYMHATVTVK
ncbi:MAG: cupredoxin family copper-binding protein [Actinomycetota bacterium]|nr:cupredoxin family copper-binding protein [Actinomycetota bacterium]